MEDALFFQYYTLVSSPRKADGKEPKTAKSSIGTLIGIFTKAHMSSRWAARRKCFFSQNTDKLYQYDHQSRLSIRSGRGTETVKRDAEKYPSFEEDLRCPDFIVLN